MYKLYENEVYVDYQIETEIPIDTFIDKKGEEQVQVQKGYAYCRFNKKTEEFVLDAAKTNPYFLMHNNRVIKAQYKLIQLKRTTYLFPSLIQIASG